jgi:hypothetical protein
MFINNINIDLSDWDEQNKLASTTQEINCIYAGATAVESEWYRPLKYSFKQKQPFQDFAESLQNVPLGY